MNSTGGENVTFLELRQLVSYWTDDLSMTYFTPVQINRFLNNAQKEVQKHMILAGQEYYTKCVVTTLVVNQREYILPSDFHKLARLEVIISGTAPNENTSRLTPIAPNQIDQVSWDVGTPGVYFFKRNRLVLWPAPQDSLVLRLNYAYNVEDMVLDNDTPDIPEVYHEMIAVLAALDCLYKDGREVAPLVEKRDYYTAMMKKDADQRNVDESRVVIQSGSYDVGGYADIYGW